MASWNSRNGREIGAVSGFDDMDDQMPRSLSLHGPSAAPERALTWSPETLLIGRPKALLPCRVTVEDGKPPANCFDFLEPPSAFLFRCASPVAHP
jgi:hypothetical protein